MICFAAIKLKFVCNAFCLIIDFNAMHNFILFIVHVQSLEMLLVEQTV